MMSLFCQSAAGGKCRGFDVLCGPRVTVRPGDQRCGIFRPALHDGNIGQIHRIAFQHFCWHGAPRRRLVGIFNTCLNCGSLSNRSRNPFGGSGSFRKASSLPTSRNAVTSSCPIPSATRRCAKQVAQHRHGVAFWVFKQQRRAARAQGAVSDFCHFQIRINRKRNAFEFALLFQQRRKSRRSWYFMQLIMASL